MPEDEDKYPTQSGRRRFVKGVVGSAALSGVAAGTAATVNSATSPGGVGGGATQFIAIENTAGPAPRGMPVIPVEIDGGELRGLWPETREVQEAGRTIQVAEQDVGGVTYSSSWFQYCGVQQYSSTQPGLEANNAFLAGGGYEWMNEVERGEPLTVDMFDDYEEWGNGVGQEGLGKPASATWRQPEEGRGMPVQVIRSVEVERMANGEGQYANLPGDVQSFISAATQNGFMAWLNKCTHFCCTPGFKNDPGSEQYGGGDQVYCQCHQSLYNPFSPVRAQFVALPRPLE